MAESEHDNELMIELVWLKQDWPQASPVEPNVLATIDPDAYALAGQRSDQPRLARGSLRLAGRLSLEAFLARPEMAKLAAAIESGTIAVAVNGRRGRAAYRLANGDRVELLGGITADPRSERLARVRKDRSVAGRDKWRTV